MSLKKNISCCLFFVSLSLGLTFIRPSFIQAEFTDDFSLTASTSATVTADGKTTITTDFTLVNLTASKYLPEYILQFDQPDLKQISVTPSNDKDKINLKDEVKDQDTVVTLTFDTEKVGEGKSHAFQIKYEAPSAAKISGKTLDFNLPIPSQMDQFSSESSIKIIIPSEFGEAVFTTPQPTSVTPDSKGEPTQNTFLYERTNIPQNYSLKFGQNQLYELRQAFTLKNQHSSVVDQQVVIPSDTPWQTLHYLEFLPQPTQIQLDQAGNWIATYHLEPQSELRVEYKAEITFGLQPNQVFNFPGSLSNLDEVTFAGLEFVAGQPLPTTTQEWSYTQPPADLNHLALVIQTPKIAPLLLDPLPDTTLEPREKSSQPPILAPAKETAPAAPTPPPIPQLEPIDNPDEKDDSSASATQDTLNTEKTASASTNAATDQADEVEATDDSETIDETDNDDDVGNNTVEEDLATPTDEGTALVQMKIESHPNYLFNLLGWQQITLHNTTGAAFYHLQIQTQIEAHPTLTLDSQPQTLETLLPFQSGKHIIKPTPQNWFSWPNTLTPSAELQIKIESPHQNLIIYDSDTNQASSTIVERHQLQIIAPQVVALATIILSLILITGGILVFRPRKKGTVRR